MSDLDDDDADDMQQDEGLFERAKRRHKLAMEATAKQRRREREALRFQVPSLQWDEDAKRQRLGTAQPGVPTPPRPCLAVSKVDQPIRMVTNQERNAHLGVQIHPLTPDAEDETAEVLQDLYRAIERKSRANLARSWAFDRCAKVGMGCYRVLTCYDETAEEGTPEAFDQDIVIGIIHHQETVLFDPAAVEPDFSDANWAFVGTWMSLQDFKAQFPEAEIPSKDEFTEESETDPEWVRFDDKGQPAAILVTEYWEKRKKVEKISIDGAKGKQERERESVTLYYCRLSGAGALEDEQEQNGKLIPLIPVPGRELQPFDGERRFVGIIEPNMDAQRIYNYAASNAVELVALEPKMPYVGARGQFEGFEAQWQQANTRAQAYLEYNPKVDGVPEALPPPQRSQVDASRLGPTMMLLQQANDFLQTGTAQFDPSLGRQNSNEKSGRAIMALQQQGDAATSDFLANLADISIRYEARVVLDLIPHIYDRPGRIARIMDEHDQSRPVMLNAPFTVDEKTGMPQSVPVDQEGNPVMPLPPGTKTYDLSKGRYGVAVTVGRSKQSRMESVAMELGQILESRPELMPLIGPEYFRHRDFPGAQDIADNLLILRNQQYPALADKEKNASPEQLQAENAALKQDMQRLQQELQAAGQQIEMDSAKEQVKGQIVLAGKAMDNATKERISTQDNQVKLLIAEQDRKFEMLLKAIEGIGASKEAQKDRDHERAQGAAQAGSETFPKTFAASVGLPLEAPSGEV